MGLGLVIVLLAIYGLTTTMTANLSTILQPYLRLKDMVALGEIMKALGLIFLVMGTNVGNTNFWVVLVGQVVGGSGFSLAISSDGSLLRAITARAGNELFIRTQSQSQSLMFIATLVAGCAGSILYDYEAHWPFYASLLSTLTASAVIALIREDGGRSTISVTEGASASFHIDDKSRFWMNFYSLSRAYTLGPFVGFLPFFFIELQVDPYLFGSVLGLFSLFAFLSALYANAFLKRFGLRALMATTLISMLGSMLLFGFTEWFSRQGIDYFVIGLVAIALLGIGSGGVRPVAMANVKLDKLKPDQRTRLLGQMERNFGLCNGILLMAGGYILAVADFEVLMRLLGVSYVIMIGLLLTARGDEAAGKSSAFDRQT
jgi:MFS family permease